MKFQQTIFGSLLLPVGSLRGAALCLGLAAAILAVSPVGAITYGPPVQLSTTPVNFWGTGGVQINNKGWVVWVGQANNSNQIYLYDGSVTKNISKNGTNNGVNYQVINDQGMVAWTATVSPSSMGTNIWTYANGVTGEITTDETAVLGDLNNSNEIVYTDRSPWGFGIFLYPGNLMLTDDGQSPRLNNHGQIIYLDSSSQLRLYSGSDQVISAPVYGSYAINDAGQIAWGSFAGSPFQSQVYRYSGGITKNITNNANENDFYGRGMFNARGDVVWLGWPGPGTGEPDIYLYSGGVTTRLTNDGQGSGAYPQINDSGQIVWGGSDSHGSLHIYLYSGGVVQTVADVGSSLNAFPVINNQGQIAYVSIEDQQVYLLSPVGLGTKMVAPMLNLLLDN
jgi:hypothetical protein